MLAFQVREIESADLKPGEEEDVAEAFRRASHAERLLELAAEAGGILSEQDDSAADRLGHVVRLLDELSRMDAPAAELAERSRDLAIQARELGAALVAYADGLESDPESLRRLEQRVDLIESLRRKYGPTVEEILEFGGQGARTPRGTRGTRRGSPSSPSEEDRNSERSCGSAAKDCRPCVVRERRRSRRRSPATSRG